MRIAKLSLVMIVLALPFLAASPAAAQAFRTWVSGIGNDMDVCSRTLPCRTFAAAIAQTAAGGEINCLDSGGFGSVTITKSITILCEGVVGGVLASGTFGINIAAASTDTVTLKGLDIDGVGTGTFGINIQSAQKVTILNTSIRNFRADINSVGIVVTGNQTTTVNIQDSTILDNYYGILGSTSASFYKIVNMKNVMITGSTLDGIHLPTTNLFFNIFESVISNNGNYGVRVSSGTSTANVRRSQINNNIIGGLRTASANALINVSQSDLLNNTAAFSNTGGGVIASDGLNNVVGAVGTNPNGVITLK